MLELRVCDEFNLGYNLCDMCGNITPLLTYIIERNTRVDIVELIYNGISSSHKYGHFDFTSVAHMSDCSRCELILGVALSYSDRNELGIKLSDLREFLDLMQEEHQILSFNHEEEQHLTWLRINGDRYIELKKSIYCKDNLRVISKLFSMFIEKYYDSPEDIKALSKCIKHSRT